MITIPFFLKQKIKKLTKEFVRIKKFREYKEIQNILLLFNLENLTEVEDFVHQLTRDGKKVLACSFDSKIKIIPRVPENFIVWNTNQLDIYGIPLQTELKTLTDFSSDTLIDLTTTPTPVLQYLFLNATSDFRVGFNRENAGLYDLLIERNPEHDFSFFVNQMLFYLKSLHTK